MIHDREVPRVPQPSEGVPRGQRLEVVAAVIDELSTTAEAGQLVAIRGEPLIYLGAFGFTVEKTRVLAELLTEVADIVGSGVPPLPASPDDGTDPSPEADA